MIGHRFPRRSLWLLGGLGIALSIHAFIPYRLWLHFGLPAGVLAGLVLLATLKHLGFAGILSALRRKRPE